MTPAPKRRWFRFIVSILFWEPSVGFTLEPKESALTMPNERPLVAIWEHTPGFTFGSQAPYLRIAIWSDGTVLFAKDPSKWGHELRKGMIAVDRGSQLRKAIHESGIFSLKQTNYLPVDAPTDCMMVDLGTKRQILYSDESGLLRENNPKLQELKHCWTLINQMALLACPTQSESAKGRLMKTPESWFIDNLAR